MEKPFPLPKIAWYLLLSLLLWLPLSPFVVTVTKITVLSLYREIAIIGLVYISWRNRRVTKQYLLDDTERLILILVILALLSTILITHDLGALVWSARYSLEPWAVYWALHPFSISAWQWKKLLSWWLKLATLLVVIGLMMVTVIGKTRLVALGYNAEVAVGNGQWTAQATLPAYQTVAGSLPRLQSTMSGPIQFAGFILIALCLLPFVRSQAPQWYPAASLITLAGLIGTFSRAAWIAAAVYLIWQIGASLRRKGWTISDMIASTLIIFVIVTAGGGLLLFKADNEPTRQLVAEILNREGSDREHVQSISQSLAQWPQIATTGFGFGRSGAGSIQNAARNSNAPAPRFVDNSYLRWLEELGPLGLLVFLSLLSLIIRDLWLDPTKRLLAWAGLSLAIAASFTDMWLEAAPVITWAIMAALMHPITERTSVSTEPKLAQYQITPLNLLATVNQLKEWAKSQRPHTVVTLNPEMFVTAVSNSQLATAISNADLITADGTGIIAGLAWVKWAEHKPRWMILLFGWLAWIWIYIVLIIMPGQLRPTAFRVTGSDIVRQILPTTTNLRLAILGSTDKTLTLAKQRLQQLNNPHLRLVLCETGPEPSSAGVWPDTERRKLFSRLAHAKPDILLLAYGVPKQELLMQNYSNQLKVPVMIGISGALDSEIAHTVKRAPKLIQDLQLEWLWRLLLQPKRIGRIFRAVWQYPLTITRLELDKRGKKG